MGGCNPTERVLQFNWSNVGTLSHSYWDSVPMLDYNASNGERRFERQAMAAQREIPFGETIEVEFKSEFKRDENGELKPSRLPDSELMDTVVALSNTNGGNNI